VKNLPKLLKYPSKVFNGRKLDLIKPKRFFLYDCMDSFEMFMLWETYATRFDISLAGSF